MKLILTSFLSFLLLLTVTSQAFATSPPPPNLNVNPCNNAQGVASITCRMNDLGAVIGGIVSFLFVIAVIIALFYLIWGGIKWITSGGDKAGVEGARNHIVAAIIGLIVVFISFIILNLILNFFGMSLTNLTLPTLKPGPTPTT